MSVAPYRSLALAFVTLASVASGPEVLAQAPAYVRFEGTLQFGSGVGPEENGSYKFFVYKESTFNPPAFAFDLLADDGSFSVNILRTDPISDMYFRVATRDYATVSSTDIFRSEDDLREAVLTAAGTLVLRDNFVLARLVDRYDIEMKAANVLIERGDYDLAFKSLRNLSESFLSQRSDLFYRPTQRVAELIEAGFGTSGNIPLAIYTYIYDIESMPSFIGLNAKDKAAIYLQYARGLSKSPLQLRANVRGKNLWKIIYDCFYLALVNDRAAGSSMARYAIYKEMISVLFKAEEYDLAIETIDLMLAEMIGIAENFDHEQNKAIVYAAVTAADILARRDDILSYSSDEEYVAVAVGDPDKVRAWKRYLAIINKNPSLFADRGGGRESKLVRRFMAIGTQVASAP